LLSDLPEAEPRFIRKMDCVAVALVDQIPATKDWLREIKWDGYRVCVIKRPKSVSLRTKSNREPSARYKHVAKSLSESELPPCVLDAELVALNDKERPVFQLLQQSRRNRAHVVIYAFDILNYNGRDLTKLPLVKRRATLEALAPEFPEDVRLSELLPEDTEMRSLVAILDEHGLKALWSNERTPYTARARSPVLGSSTACITSASSSSADISSVTIPTSTLSLWARETEIGSFTKRRCGSASMMKRSACC
jgi:bifunctional non-homologous end joining protein LigD